jgi:hypothetical protein
MVLIKVKFMILYKSFQASVTFPNGLFHKFTSFYISVATSTSGVALAQDHRALS